MSLTPEQVKIVKSTGPVLAQHGTTITKTMYDNMLRDEPALWNVFSKANQDNGEQPRALAGSLVAYAAHIDDLGALTPTLELICHKHVSLHIRKEQYDVVAKYLLSAMGEVLGDALTPEILDAWTAAYWQLANIMSGKEKALYETADGWTDWKDFRIAKKDQESDEITSFYLEPVDEKLKPLPSFLPGQYISIQTSVPALKHLQSRQYSLSDAPWPDYYRISVKREAGLPPLDRPDAAGHPGYISNLLHDEKSEGDILQVSHPFGDFHIDPASFDDVNSPVILLSAGVGLTPLISILNSLVANHSSRPISWIHGARSSNVRAFAPHIKNVARVRDNVHHVFFVTKLKDGEEVGVDYDFQGHVVLDKLDRSRDLHIDNARSQYFVCGPATFMRDMQKGLTGMGVTPNRVHMELFGTGGLA